SFHGLGFDRVNPFAWPSPRLVRRADVVHVHQLCTWVSDACALPARPGRQALVGTDHGGGGFRVLNRRLPVYRRYQAVTGQSRLAVEQLEPTFQGRTHLVPGGVDPDRFRPGRPDNTPTILYVGRMLPHKGIHLLIDAFRQAGLDTWHLKLVGPAGDPAYLADLHQRARGMPVTFVHDADNTAVIRAYQAARLLVLPSERRGSGQPPELMGFTVLEAQACGIPVLVSDAGPMAEFIEEGVTGFSFSAGDCAALVEGLRAASALPPDTASACRQHVLAFSWETVARQFVSLYRSILA
ncbi:MAG: glycosyltransferase family 4 protein, partial [Opitutales bacterium]